MNDDSWAKVGAAAGAVAVALFVAAALIVPSRPGFETGGAEIAAWFAEGRTRIQVGSALLAVAGPLLVWFLATVASLTRDGAPAARRAGLVAFGCGLVLVVLFLADVTALAVGALRPENMLADPELAAALQDFELLAMGMAAFAAAGTLAAFAVLALRDNAIWPRWVGWLAAIAAPAYALRVGTLRLRAGRDEVAPAAY